MTQAELTPAKYLKEQDEQTVRDVLHETSRNVHPDFVKRQMARGAIVAFNRLMDGEYAKAPELLDGAKKGDTIVFDSGLRAILTVCYRNGSGYFIRWAVPGKAWSETDLHCCHVCQSPDGKYAKQPSPYDIVEVISSSGLIADGDK